MRYLTLPALLLCLYAGAPALAGELVIKDAWSRSTPPGSKVGVLYLTIDNGSNKSDRLLKLKTPVASSVEVHRTEVVEGVARMREVSIFHVGVGEHVEFQPGGLHMMLIGLKKPLVEGKTFELQLLFEVAGPRKVKVAVRNP